MNAECIANVQQRIARQKAFFESDKAQVMPYFRKSLNFTPYITELLHEKTPKEICNRDQCDGIARDFLKTYRQSLKVLFQLDDDSVPWIQIYAGIGSVTGAMTGSEVDYMNGAAWCEPGLSWEEVENLKFDPENIWVKLALELNKAFCRQWGGDFAICPFIHRSPLDAANGIRGTELFVDMYAEKERAERLIDWCAEWSISLERHFTAEVDYPDGMERAVWGTWLPENGVFVNGDPVGLISREMQPEFEGYYTGKFFKACDAGFFHNHSMGIYQTDLIAETDHIHVLEIIPDMDRPHTIDLIKDNEDIRAKILYASRKVPVMFDAMPIDRIKEFLPYLRHPETGKLEGKFIVSVIKDDNLDESTEVLDYIRKFK